MCVGGGGRYGLSGMSSTDLDLYFGQHLLMHVFPMAPMPLNDHSIQPGNATVDRLGLV